MAKLILSDFSQKGEKIYREQILPNISENMLKGKFVAIEVESGRYFINDLDIEALFDARREFPEKQFYLKKIGYAAAHSHKGVVKKAVL